MDGLVEARWTRYGKDRVYVRTADGTAVGYVDLKSRTVESVTAGYEAALDEVLQRWDGQAATDAAVNADPLEGVVAPELEASAEIAADLSTNRPGAAVRAKHDEVLSQSPGRYLLASIFNVHTDERAWRVGAKGEASVGRRLDRLRLPWRVLHSVPVGERGSDIDHLVIGPGGVFTINTKRHPRAKVWMSENVLMVNGHRTDYLRNSRFEAQRASRLLSNSCGFTVEARPVIVLAGIAGDTVRGRPSDVDVLLNDYAVRRWMENRPTLLTTETIESIYDVARLSTTWQPAKPVN